MNKLIPTRIWLIFIARLLIFSIALFWPAGSWLWWEAWVVIFLWTCFALAMMVYLSRHDPALLAERMKLLPLEKDQRVWDKALMVVFVLAAFALYIIPGLDVVRYAWSEPLPLWMEITAMLLVIPCFILLIRIMLENTFLSQIVKIDDERGHEVITTGPYAFVRHPMYTVAIVIIFSLPVALGSRYGLIPAAILTMILIVRTHFEDRTLHKELAGYPEYAKQTPYRLIPGIW